MCSHLFRPPDRLNSENHDVGSHRQSCVCWNRPVGGNFPDAEQDQESSEADEDEDYNE